MINQVGNKISGTYHGVAYTGTVVESRIETTTHKYLLTVELDAPITVYSQEKTRIHFLVV